MVLVETSPLVTRAWLYTSITRSRHLVLFVEGGADAMGRAISRRTVRTTGMLMIPRAALSIVSRAQVLRRNRAKDRVKDGRAGRSPTNERDRASTWLSHILDAVRSDHASGCWWALFNPNRLPHGERGVWCGGPWSFLHALLAEIERRGFCRVGSQQCSGKSKAIRFSR